MDQGPEIPLKQQHDPETQEFRKGTYADLKQMFGSDYDLTEDEFNNNMDSDPEFVVGTFKDLKQMFGSDYDLTEDEFKKKVQTQVTGQGSGTGLSNGLSSLGSAGSLAPSNAPLRTKESAIYLAKVQGKKIPELKIPDTTAIRDETIVAPKTDRIAKSYTPQEVKNQDDAFSIAYQAVKDNAVKPRKDKPLLTNTREDVEELDRKLVDVAVEAAGKKFSLEPYEKTNLRNRIIETYKQEPSADKAFLAAGMEFKGKYGATPQQIDVFAKEKKLKEIEANAVAQVGEIKTRLNNEVVTLNQALEPIAQSMVQKYESMAQSGELPPEQIQKAFESERNELIRTHAESIKTIQSRFIKEFNDAQVKAKTTFEEFAASSVGDLNPQQKEEFQESYKKHFAAAEKQRNKDREQMFRNKPISEQVETAFAMGLGDLYSSIGGALGMAGFDDANYKITKAVEAQAAAMGGDVVLEPESLGDTSWWIANGVRTAPMMIALAPIGMVGGGVAATGARLAGAAERYSSLASTVGGGLVGWKAETYMEQALGFQQALADGKTPDEAAQIAVDIGKLNVANLPLQMMEMAPFFHKMPLALGATVGVVSGAAEEVSQGWATNKAFAISENREYEFMDYVKDPEFGITAVLGGAMSAPFVIGGAIRNSQDKRNAIGGTVRNLVNSGSFAKASGVVQAAYDNGAINEQTLADFNIAIDAAAKAASQIATITDPVTSAAVEQSLSDGIILQQQASSAPPGPVQDALNTQAEVATAQVQSIISETAPVMTIQRKSDEAPTVMSEQMMTDFLANPQMIQAIADGEINVTIRNNPKLEQQVVKAVEKFKQRKEIENTPDLESDIPKTIDQLKSGEPVMFNGVEGVIVKDKETGENIFVSRSSKESIISGGGDTSTLEEKGITTRRKGKVSFEGKDYYVVESGGENKVFTKSDKGALIESPLGKAKKEEIISSLPSTPKEETPQGSSQIQQGNEQIPVQETTKQGEEEVAVIKGNEIETWKPIKINTLKNPEKSPDMGERFGQDVEPTGNYVTQNEGFVPEGWTTDEVNFKNPLVIDITPEKLIEWKRDLSNQYDGKKGNDLTSALIAEGYDGIITRVGNEIGEIINLTPQPESGIEQKGDTLKHKQNIHDKFRKEFGSKGIPKEQVDGAIALMEARAKSWASEETGRMPEQWYEKIADIKSGEFETKEEITVSEIVNEVKAELPKTEKKEVVKEQLEVESEPQPKVSAVTETDAKKQPINKIEDLQDVGEKIGGAKKDLAQKLSEVTTEDLAIKPLSKVFPKPDFKKLVEEGSLSEDGAILLNFLYEKIPTKPRKQYRVANWVKTVDGALQTTRQVLEAESTKNLDFTQKILRAVTLSETLKRDYKLYSDTMNGLGFPKNDVNLRGYEIKKFENRSKFNKETGKLEPVKGEVYSVVSGSSIIGDFKTMDDAINGLKTILNKSEENTQGTKFDIYQDRKTKEFFIGKKGAIDVVRIVQGFKTLGEARNFLKEKQADIQGLWDAMKAPKERRMANRPRVGVDWRKGKNVDSKEFADTFGFRGVEFGNWVNNAERQSHVNEAHDALMDLSSVLGVSPKALSLNGELGFAFGARGSGKANAHYEAGKVVINLTKTRGAGSLAHEWWHAMDNYFSRSRGQKESFITQSPIDRIERDGSINLGVRKEMIDAFKSVVDAIKSTKLSERSKVLDRTRSDTYWSTSVEMSARSFENFIIEKLGERNQQNDYLANFKETSEWINDTKGDIDAIKNYPYPLAEESPIVNEKFQQFFETIKEGEDAKLFQDNKGAVETLSDGRKVIHALDSPDFSTMVHEIAHVFEGDLTAAEQKIVKDFGGSEPFARGFEKYLRDGKAPTTELKTLFDKFKQWLTDIYKTLKGSPIEKRITPEIKQIFERLLTEQKGSLGEGGEVIAADPTPSIVIPEGYDGIIIREGNEIGEIINLTPKTNEKGEGSVGGEKKYLAKGGDSPDIKRHNIDTAKSLLSDLGVDASFSSYSDANGVSVYFIDSNGKKIRVSNHGVTNKDRMANEVLLSFDTKTLGLDWKKGFKSYAEQNKKAVEQYLKEAQVLTPEPIPIAVTQDKVKDAPTAEKEKKVPHARERAKVVEGKMESIKFRGDEHVPVTYALIEGETLQPSHEASGERNKEHTIASAQPKERNDKGSKMAQDKIAAKPNLKEVGASPNAYFGAPIINEAGEVIQGNNRSIGLKKHYRQGGKSYKEQLIENAAEFGLTPEQVSEMKNPVLVRVAKVDDATAIQLGQFDVKDLETGGKQRIDPLVTSRKIIEGDKSKIAALIFDDKYSTINEAIRENAVQLGTILKNYINPAQFNNAFNKEGKLTTSGITDLQSTINHFLFDGGPVELPEIFDQLPASTKKGLEKSLKHVFSTPKAASLLPELQNAILALGDYLNTGEGEFNMWKNSVDLFLGKSPKEIFSPLELKLTETILNAKGQSEVSGLFQKYSELVTGKPGDMFEPETKGVSKNEAVKQLFNIQTNESIQESSTEKVDVRESSTNGKRVGERNAQEQNAPPPNQEVNETIAPEAGAVELTPKDLIAQGIEGIMNKIGGVKNLTEQERTTIIQDLKNIFEGIIKQTGISLKEAIDAAIEHLKFSGKYKNITARDTDYIERALKGQQQIPSENLPKKTDKKSVNLRAYQGAEGIEIKQAIKDIGLNYDVQHNESSMAYADEIMQRYGRDVALAAARDNTVVGQPAAHLFAKIIDDVGREISNTTDPDKLRELINHQAALIDEFGSQARVGGQYNQAIDKIYETAEFPYMVGAIRNRAKEANGGESVPVDVQTKLDQMAADIQAMNERIKENDDARSALEAQLVFEKMAADILRTQNAPNIKAKEKTLANKIRQAKLHRPGTFSAATPASVVWDSAVELVALSVETGQAIAQAVSKGIALIQESKWYKELEASKQKAALDDFTNYWKGEDYKDDSTSIVTIDSKTGRVEVPYALIKQLVSEGVTDVEDLTRKVHDLIRDEFPDVTHREVRDGISNYGKQKFPSTNEVKKEIARLRRDGQLLSGYEDALSGKRPKKTGQQRTKPTPEQREMMRKIKDLLKKFPQDADAVDKAYASAQDRIASALKNRIEDLKKQIDAGVREVRDNKPVEYSDANKELRREVDALEKELDDLVGPKTLTHEERVDRAVNRTMDSLDDLDIKIATAELSYKTAAEKLNDPILTALREVKAAKLKILNEMREASGIAEQKRLDTYKSRVKKEIARLQERLANKDFEKPIPKEELQLDNEAKQLAVEKLRLKDEVDLEVEKLRLKNRDTLEKFTDGLINAGNLSRSILTSGDMSAIGRQGLIMSVRHPVLAARAFTASLNFLKSEANLKAYERAVRSSPYFYDMQKAGLGLTFGSVKLSAKEETVMNRIIEKIPIASHTARAYVGFLNKLRVDVFMESYELFEKSGLTGKELDREMAGIAKIINMTTGRGELPKSLNQYLPAFNAVAFAARFAISRFQTLGRTMTLGYGFTPYKKGEWFPNRIPRNARIEFYKTMGSYVGFMTTMTFLMKMGGADVEDDPRSSDFGKWKFGNTRDDLWAGLSQIAVLFSRLFSGQVKNATTGEIEPLNSGGMNETTYVDVITNFLENKASPVIGMALEKGRGRYKFDKKFYGKTIAERSDPADMIPMILNNFSPMWFADIPDIAAEEGTAKAIAHGTASFFGASVQHYTPSFGDRVQRETQDAIVKQLQDTNKDNFLDFDLDKQLVDIREKLKDDPEFNSKIFNKRVRDAFVLSRLNGKPDWYRDVFYAASNEKKVEIIQKNATTQDEINAATEELLEIGAISKTVQYETMGDENVKDLLSRLEDQEFNSIREKARMEMMYNKFKENDPTLIDDIKSKSDIRKLLLKNRKATMGHIAELALQLNVTNGARSEYIYDMLNSLNKTEEEKSEWLDYMIDKKVITKEVAKNFALISAQKKIEKNQTQPESIPDVEMEPIEVEQ